MAFVLLHVRPYVRQRRHVREQTRAVLVLNELANLPHQHRGGYHIQSSAYSSTTKSQRVLSGRNSHATSKRRRYIPRPIRHLQLLPSFTHTPGSTILPNRPHLNPQVHVLQLHIRPYHPRRSLPQKSSSKHNAPSSEPGIWSRGRERGCGHVVSVWV